MKPYFDDPVKQEILKKDVEFYKKFISAYPTAFMIELKNSIEKATGDKIEEVMR